MDECDLEENDKKSFTQSGHFKPTDFFNRVKDELDLEDSEIFSIPHPQNKKPQKCANLNTDQMLLIGMRESKAVRKSVLAKLKWF